MFRSLRNAALLAIVVLPVLGASAQAQPYDPGCRKDNRDNTTAGTVVGGVAGAILGSAVAGRHDRAAGAVIGGVGGALVGHEIAKSNEHPCPAGYYYVAPPPPPPRPMPPPPQPPPPPPPPEYRPVGVHERIDVIQARLDRASQSGRIPYGQAKRLNRELGDIRRQDDQLRYRDGGRLTPQDRDYLMNRLDGVSRRLQDMTHDRWDDHDDRDHDRDRDHDHDHHDRD